MVRWQSPPTYRRNKIIENYITTAYIFDTFSWITLLGVLAWIISKLTKVSFKQIVLWIVLTIVSFIIAGTMLLTLLYFIFSAVGKNDIEKLFEHTTSISFPSDANVIEHDCPFAFGGGGYICEGKVRLSEETYNFLLKKQENNASITHYHKDRIEWYWNLEENRTIYIKYIDY